jgi:hypothetical protein
MPYDKNYYTTIWIRRTTHSRFDRIMKKSESYDKVINMLMDVYEKSNKVEENVQ